MTRCAAAPPTMPSLHSHAHRGGGLSGSHFALGAAALTVCMWCCCSGLLQCTVPSLPTHAGCWLESPSSLLLAWWRPCCLRVVDSDVA